MDLDRYTVFKYSLCVYAHTHIRKMGNKLKEKPNVVSRCWPFMHWKFSDFPNFQNSTRGMNSIPPKHIPSVGVFRILTSPHSPIGAQVSVILVTV